ncbi:MAG TPA: LysR family transcriptional regulator [Betaproteobacteria bacterium]|nr:LysR family transcriptional regulator [Betaproteobacteria bacterium]
MKFPRTTLEQWRALQAVIEAGGFAQAGARLHRSQSAISYSVDQLQRRLHFPLLRQEGRRAALTAGGQSLLREAVFLIDGLLALENRAHALQQGWETEVRLAVDSVFPTALLLRALGDFAERCPHTRIELREVILSGADDALRSGNVDLTIAAAVPPGFLGDRLLDVEFAAVAHPAHPLHRLGRPLTGVDLARELQIVVRDSGTRSPRDEGWLGASRRWTVSSPETAIAMVMNGLGFAWLPRHLIETARAEGALNPLPLAAGQIGQATLYLVFADSAHAGPATHAIADILKTLATGKR